MDIMYVKITLGDGKVWWSSCPLRDSSPAAQVDRFNQLAVEGGILAKYEVATQADFAAYSKTRRTS